MAKETKVTYLPQTRCKSIDREIVEKAAEVGKVNMSDIIREGAVEKAQNILSSSSQEGESR